jgi:hypothetical protein
MANKSPQKWGLIFLGEIRWLVKEKKENNFHKSTNF